jgi:hypothetical protein
MRKTFANLTGLLRDMANNKSAAGQARFRKRPDKVELPRDAILAGSQMIAHELASDGFSFLPSGPRFSRKDGDLRFEIRVQSDRNNIAGHRAAVWIHAFVRSPGFQRWRVERGLALGSESYIAGGQVGNLREPQGWLEWDFADPNRRQVVANDAVTTIRERALPLFAKFQDLDAFVESLEHHVPSFVHQGVEVVLWKRGRESAAKVGSVWLRENPQKVEAYRAALEKFRNEGLPHHRSASDLAFMSVKENLNFLVE